MEKNSVDGGELDNWGQQILHKNLDVGTYESNRTEQNNRQLLLKLTWTEFNPLYIKEIKHIKEVIKI